MMGDSESPLTELSRSNSFPDLLELFVRLLCTFNPDEVIKLSEKRFFFHHLNVSHFDCRACEKNLFLIIVCCSPCALVEYFPFFFLCVLFISIFHILFELNVFVLPLAFYNFTKNIFRWNIAWI